MGNLEAADLVERTTDVADRRVSLVQITEEGRRELGLIRSQRNAWLAGRLAHLDAADLERLGQALPVLDKILELDS